MDNEMTLSFFAMSENEALARMAMTCFITPLDPTIDELSEFKTVVSEAVTNAIIHGYEENGIGIVTIRAMRNDREVTLIISDEGKGITDIDQAMEPMFTSKPHMERSGMGFTIMESFSDNLSVQKPEKGTTVTFTKQFSANSNLFPRGDK